MRYTLGPKTLMFSAGFAASSDVYSFALAEMQRVVDICLETCQLGILDGSNVFYIGKIESPEPLRLVSSVGKTIPACCTAIGKALLSNMEYQEVQALYPKGLPALTSQSLKTVDALFEQLKAVREGEVAMDMDESLAHLRCFALPIHFDNMVDAAISISGPDFRLDDAKKKLVQNCLVEARDAIEKYLQQVGRGFRSQ